MSPQARVILLFLCVLAITFITLGILSCNGNFSTVYHMNSFGSKQKDSTYLSPNMKLVSFDGQNYITRPMTNNDTPIIYSIDCSGRFNELIVIETKK